MLSDKASLSFSLRGAGIKKISSPIFIRNDICRIKALCSVRRKGLEPPTYWFVVTA